MYNSKDTIKQLYYLVFKQYKRQGIVVSHKLTCLVARTGLDTLSLNYLTLYILEKTAWSTLEYQESVSCAVTLTNQEFSLVKEQKTE